MLFYLTPIMYPSELVYARLAHSHLPKAYQFALYKLYMLNPINALTDAYRKTLLPAFHGGVRGTHVQSVPLDYQMLAVAAVTCTLVAVAGYAFFNSRKWAFAERI